MALYDDGGVNFAEQQFKEATERGIKQAKEAERAGRRQGIKDAITGRILFGPGGFERGQGGLFGGIAQAFTDRGQKLQDANIPQKTYLQNYINTYTGRNKKLEYGEENPEGFIVNGVVDINKLQNFIAGELREGIKNTDQFPDFEKLNVGDFGAFINGHAKSEANRLKDYYQRMYDEGLDLPDGKTLLDQFDKWNSRENPTDIFGQIRKVLEEY